MIFDSAYDCLFNGGLRISHYLDLYYFCLESHFDRFVYFISNFLGDNCFSAFNLLSFDSEKEIHEPRKGIIKSAESD